MRTGHRLQSMTSVSRAGPEKLSPRQRSSAARRGSVAADGSKFCCRVTKEPRHGISSATPMTRVVSGSNLTPFRNGVMGGRQARTKVQFFQRDCLSGPGHSASARRRAICPHCFPRCPSLAMELLFFRCRDSRLSCRCRGCGVFRADSASLGSGDGSVWA
jgi:hypothetical protein